MKNKLAAWFLLLCMFMSMAGCAQSSTAHFDINAINTYRDIPGVTAEEISAIEALKESRASFSFGQLLETEAFILPDGSYAGFTSYLCQLLEGLFGIEFTQIFYDEWGSLKNNLDDLSLDFINDFTPTPERELTYFMTLPVAERALRIFVSGNPDVYMKETDINGLKIGFWENSSTAESIRKRYPFLSFIAVNIDSYESAAEKLRSGMIDMFVVDGVIEPAFEEYDFIQSKEFFPLIYTPVSLTTANQELAAVITVMNKYLAAGGTDKLFQMYKQGEEDYAKYKLRKSFTAEEIAYLDNRIESGEAVRVALEHDNYPVSFYNENAGEFQGMAPDILERVSKLTGLQFEIATTKDSTWTEIIQMLETGQISLVSHLLYSAERTEYFIWSIPYDTVNCAMISRLNYDFLETYQIPSKTVGTLKDSAFETMYGDWFPDAAGIVTFDTMNQGMEALENGEIDLYMGSEYSLLGQINYREKSGFKTNILFNATVDSMFGFNKNEEKLRDIINKTLDYVKLNSISTDWKNQTFDYSQAMTRARSIYLTIFSCLLAAALLALFVLLLRNKRLSKGLEIIVQERTAELERQTATITNSLEELSVYNGILTAVQGTASVVETIESAAAILREMCWFDRMTIVQRISEPGSPYRIIASCPQMEGPLPEYDIEILRNLHPGERVRFSADKFPGAAAATHTVYAFGVAEWECSVIFEFSQADRELNEHELELITRSVALFESMIVKKLSEAAMERVLHSIDAMIYVSELETGKILFLNKIMEENYGIHDARGKICWQVFQSGMTGPCSFCPINKMTDENSPPVVWEEHSFITGRYYQNSDRLIRWVDNRLVHIQHSMDITALKEAEQSLQDFAGQLEKKVDERTEELRLMTQRAEEASRAKSMFLANMSHEIRTPMNAVIGITELLLNENLDSRKMKYVTEIHTSAKSLLSIINDILDLSKISEGKLPLMPVDSDIILLLKNVSSLMSFTIQSKGLDFIEDIKIKPHEYARMDETRVKQILINLLSNASKFTNSGCVKLEAIIENGNIVFKVSDTGIGIKPEAQPKVFAAFEQADIHKNRAIKGTGLGLSITKSLVEMMGGNIWLESEYGVGTTFYVTIPYVEGKQPAEKSEKHAAASLMAPAAHVLIVDDIQANLTVGAGLMKLYGITADMALSGTKAMELIESTDYDIIFMDHMMPGEDGIEVTKKIRKLGGKYEKLPVIALTANAINEAKELLLNSGMDDFLAKPIERCDLTAILRKWLPAEKIEFTVKDGSESQYEDRSGALRKAAQIDGMDIGTALKRLGGIQDILEESLRQTAYSISSRLHKMDECLTVSDMKRFSIEAHGFKSSLANIGAMEYSILAAELETSADAEDYAQCAAKFALFASVLEGLAAELKLIFPEQDIQKDNIETGSEAYLAEQTEKAISWLEAFDTDEALAALDELLRFTYGEDTDALLTKAKKAVEAYEHGEAIQILRQIISGKGENE